MADTDRTSTAIAMVATSTDRLPDAARIVRASGIGDRDASLDHAEANFQHAWKDGNLVFGAHGGSLAVSLMPAPIPWSELEGPCATAWWWRAAAQQMRSHRFHFLVAMIGGTCDPVERRVIITNVVREVIETSDSVGVYWGEGTLVHEPKTFLALTKAISSTKIPGMAWIDVRVERTDGKMVRCFTTGLVPLGFREIEVERSSLPPRELIDFIGNVACYIVNGRLEIKHGETMGHTATEQYRVRHAPSMFGRGEVMRLEMV